MLALRYRKEILESVKGKDIGSVIQKFSEIARTESDCNSHKRGGDLGGFGRERMQTYFECAAFGLFVGQLSSIVLTDSGVHLILRYA